MLKQKLKFKAYNNVENYSSINSAIKVKKKISNALSVNNLYANQRKHQAIKGLKQQLL